MPFRDRHTRCPRCESSLEEATLLGSAEVLRCKSCPGVFVDHQTIARLTRAVPRSAFERLEQPNVTGPEWGCPRCFRDLVPCTIGGVTIDGCEEHGAWFDDDELARLTITKR